MRARDRTDLVGLPPKAQTKLKAMSTEKLGAGSIANFKLIVEGKIMARVPLLAKLNEDHLGTVFKESRIATYESGDVLIFEGDIGNKQSGVAKYKLHVLF